jgi:RNA polymerase sigma factor FliA
MIAPRNSALTRVVDDPSDVELSDATFAMVRRVVREIAARVPRSVEREELFAAGMLGLAQARRSYRPEVGVPFDVHARGRVTGAILDDLRSRDWLTRPQRVRARVVVDAIRTVDAESERTDAREEDDSVAGAEDRSWHPASTQRLVRGPSGELLLDRRAAKPSPGADRIGQIAQRARMSPSDVRQTLSDLDRANRLQQAVGLADSEGAAQVPATSVDPLAHVIDQELLEHVRGAVAQLPTRLRKVVEGVYFEERQMQSLAIEMGVTPSRVSQLCAEGLSRLKLTITAFDRDVPLPTGRPANRASDRLAG